MTNEPSTPSVLDRLTILGSPHAALAARAVTARPRANSRRWVVAASFLIPGAPLSVAAGCACGDEKRGSLLPVFVRPRHRPDLVYPHTRSSNHSSRGYR